MTRFERKLFFERLMALREAYRTEAHESSDLTVEGVIAFAERTFNDAADADAATIPSATKGAAAAG